jgi:hypothetical protein
LWDAITVIENPEGCPELRVDSVTPWSGEQGETLQLEIVGDGFNPGSEIDPPLGIIASEQFVDSQHLTVRITIQPDFPAPQEVYFFVTSPADEGNQTVRFYFDVERAATSTPSGYGIPGFPYLAIAFGIILSLIMLKKVHS